MTGFFNFSVLLVLLPILAGCWKPKLIIPFFVLAGIGLVGSALATPSTALKTILMGEIPLLLLLTGTAKYFSSFELMLREREKNFPLQEAVKTLRERHAALKEAVSKGDLEEARSLQIYGVSKSMAESLSWREMSPRLASGLQKLFGAYEFLLYAIDDTGWNLLQRRGHWAKEPPLSSGIQGEAAMIYPPQIQENVPVLSIPIPSFRNGETRVIGVLFLKSSDQNKSPEELILTAREFGSQLGAALNKALLFSQMEEHSRVDGLTGALRRIPFMDRMNQELKRAAVFHTPFSLMMVDIDHFKAINDTHGHAAGDAVLRRVGQILKESVYETDIVGRYGGEEFVILLPRADAEGVLRKAEALRHRFEVEVIPSGFENLKVTVSIGVAHYPEAGQTAEGLIASADRALYQAKGSGRNKVVAA